MPGDRPHKRRSKPKTKQGGKGKRGGGSSSGVSVRKLGSGGWVLVHPRAAVQRFEDLEEVRLMIDAGEFEVAVDELRWLLSGCSELMAAHVMLGELALEMGPDIKLARGHFGFAYQLGEKALRKANVAAQLSASQPANRPLFEAARGLAWCMEKLDRPQTADEIIATTRRLDSSDPLGIAELIDDLRSGGLPVIGLGE